MRYHRRAVTPAIPATPVRTTGRGTLSFHRSAVRPRSIRGPQVWDDQLWRSLLREADFEAQELRDYLVDTLRYDQREVGRLHHVGQAARAAVVAEAAVCTRRLVLALEGILPLFHKLLVSSHALGEASSLSEVPDIFCMPVTAIAFVAPKLQLPGIAKVAEMLEARFGNEVMLLRESRRDLFEHVHSTFSKAFTDESIDQGEVDWEIEIALRQYLPPYPGHDFSRHSHQPVNSDPQNTNGVFSVMEAATGLQEEQVREQELNCQGTSGQGTLQGISQGLKISIDRLSGCHQSGELSCNRNQKDSSGQEQESRREDHGHKGAMKEAAEYEQGFCPYGNQQNREAVEVELSEDLTIAINVKMVLEEGCSRQASVLSETSSTASFRTAKSSSSCDGSTAGAI